MCHGGLGAERRRIGSRGRIRRGDRQSAREHRLVVNLTVFLLTAIWACSKLCGKRKRYGALFGL